MSRKQRQVEHFMNQAHQKVLNSEAQRCASSIKTTAFIKPANANQRALVKSIKENQITIVQGPAGTGKTILSLFQAVMMLNDKESGIEKILYIRANVDIMEEKELGSIPGSIQDKMKPLTYPVLDNLITFMKETDANYLIDEGKIEALPVTMMRGRSFNNTFVIIDEAQNITAKGMKTILTRLGRDSRMLILGDSSQVDSKFCTYTNGLSDIFTRMTRALKVPKFNQYGERVEYPVGLVEFNREDIVRNELIGWVLDLYDE